MREMPDITRAWHNEGCLSGVAIGFLVALLGAFALGYWYVAVAGVVLVLVVAVASAVRRDRRRRRMS